MNQKQTARVHRSFELLWLAVIAMSVVEIVYNWGTSWKHVLIFAAFAILGGLRYFYARKQRMRIKNRMND